MKKKKTKKVVSKNRFFFTATDELTKWINEESESLGLQPPEFIRMKLHSISAS